MDELNACTQCGFTTNSIAAFTSHIQNHEEEQIPKVDHADRLSSQAEWTSSSSSSGSEGGGTVSPSLSPSGSLTEPEKPTTPNVVEKADPVEPLKDMPLVKSSKTMHICPHCNFTTYMSQHMKSHLEAHERHQGQMYQCDICKMQFSQKANMHRHRMRHSGVKPYECRYCKKRFFRKDQMQEHSMTHIKTGADFDCPVANCTQQFSQHSQLRSHLEDSHAISPTSPASCKRCALLFANSRRLLLHYQTRHDENEAGSPSSPSENNESNESNPRKKARTDSNGDFLSLLQASNQIKAEIDQQEFKTEVPEPMITPLYNFSSEDLLMMCFNNTLAYPALLAANKVPLMNGLQLWPEQTVSSPIVPLPTDEEKHSPSLDSGSSNVDVTDEPKPQMECTHCGIVFHDQTIHLLHKGLHSESDPWRCNLCGVQCGEKYMFSTHVIFANHST